MSRCCSDHFLLFHIIVKENVEMLFFYNYCFFLNKQYFVSDKFEKYNECMKLKYSCFFSYFIYVTDVFCFFHACEKLNCDKKSVLKKCQKFNACFMKLNVKIFHLKHYQCFLKECDDKLIQKNMKIFEKNYMF